MALIAENHLQFILEIAAIIHVGIMFVLNIVPMSLSLVLFVALLLSTGFAVLFGADALLLFLPVQHYEFSHSFGPIALLVAVTALAALPMMKEVGIKITNLRIFVYILLLIITIAGGLMHRSFLILWFLGLLAGSFIISKSFRQKSIFTFKKILAVVLVVIVGFVSLEYLSRILDMPVFSPLLRISRLEEYSASSLQMVLKNTTLLGHVPGSDYWGAQSLGGSDGYITLPISMVLFFGLPFPIFYGILVNQKDMIDYMLPGIFGIAFDFGYISLIFLLIWCIFVIFIGFKILSIYRNKRENDNRKYLGREAVLIGSLAAFIAQTVVGLFIMNRSINGTALLTFIFLSAMIVGHIMIMRK